MEGVVRQIEIMCVIVTFNELFRMHTCIISQGSVLWR